MIQVRWTANCIIRCRCQSGCECVVGMNKFTWERALTYKRSVLLFAWCQNMTIPADNIVWRGSCWPWYYTVKQHLFVFINIFFLNFRADLSTNRITHTLHFYYTCETLHDRLLPPEHWTNCMLIHAVDVVYSSTPLPWRQGDVATGRIKTIQPQLCGCRLAQQMLDNHCRLH